MNLFILSKNQQRNAQYHIDKHVGKMIVEVAQQLSSAIFILNKDLAIQLQSDGIIYKPAYQKHPCTIWCSKSPQNFKWACQYGIELGKEFEFRYEKQHKSAKVVQNLLENIPQDSLFEQDFLTDFAQAMPNEYKDQDAIIAYRRYYRNDKKTFATWKKREIPSWFTQEKELVSDTGI